MWRGSGSVPPAPAPLQRAIPLFWPVHLAVWNLTGMSGIRFSGNQDVRGHCYLRGGSEGDTCHSHRVSLHQSPNYHQGNVIRASWIPGLHWSRTAHTAVQSTFGAGPRLACSGTHTLTPLLHPAVRICIGFHGKTLLIVDTELCPMLTPVNIHQRQPASWKLHSTSSDNLIQHIKSRSTRCLLIGKCAQGNIRIAFSCCCTC